VFDNADLSGQRVTYLGLVEMQANFGAALGGFVLCSLTLMLGDKSAIHAFFFVAAVVVLLITTAKFPLYRK
jgi:hypothetical protein